MPIGIIANSLSVIVGGIVGMIAGNRLSADFKEKLNMIFGICAMGMGISSIALMENMPAVIFAVIFGTSFGLLIHLGEKINKASKGMETIIGKFMKSGNHGLSEKEFEDMPVIFLTSKDDKESVMQVMSLKPDGYLLKTLEPAKIIQAVDDFFEKQKGKTHA